MPSAPTVSTLTLVLKLFVVYLAAILIFAFVVYPPPIVLFSNTPVRKYLSAMKKPQIVAFHRLFHGDPAGQHGDLRGGAEGDQRHGLPSLLPLGATINMSGNAIYYGLVAIFFAQVYQIDLHGCLGRHHSDRHPGAIGQAGVPGRASWWSPCCWPPGSPSRAAAVVCAGSFVRHDPYRPQHHRRCGLRCHRRPLFRITIRTAGTNNPAAMNKARGPFLYACC